MRWIKLSRQYCRVELSTQLLLRYSTVQYSTRKLCPRVSGHYNSQLELHCWHLIIRRIRIHNDNDNVFREAAPSTCLNSWYCSPRAERSPVRPVICEALFFEGSLCALTRPLASRPLAVTQTQRPLATFDGLICSRYSRIHLKRQVESHLFNTFTVRIY